MTGSRIRLAILVLALCGAAAPAAAQSVPWEKLPGLDPAALADAVRDRALSLMQAEKSYSGCSGTVFACVTQATPSPVVLRMAAFLVRQAARGRSDEEIHKAFMERAVSARPFKTMTLDVQAAPCIGSASAGVVIVAFADFECPYCRLVSPVLKKLAEESDGKVRYCYKTFPVKGHGDAAVATAKAGVAAHDLGRFWEFHDLMYAGFEAHADADLRGYAAKCGMDWDRFNAARASAAVKDRVATSKRDGLKVGVKSTPTVYVNGKLYQGEKTGTELGDRVLEELELITGAK